MKYAVLADIHANLPALEATLERLASERIDHYVCAGDLVGYGPHPNECVRVIAGLDAVTVAGNHDLMTIGRLPYDRCVPLARASIEWTRREATDETRTYLASLPLRTEIGAEIVLAHGSLDDPQEYTNEAPQAARQLDVLARRSPRARILVLGHTHRAAAYGDASGFVDPSQVVSLASSERYVLNPGSVGQSREETVAARSLILDLERREARYLSIPYDVEACREALVRRGLPEHSYHLPPRDSRRAARAIRSVARRALTLIQPR